MRIGGNNSWELGRVPSSGVRVSPRNSLVLQFDGLFYQYKQVKPVSVTASSYYSPNYTPYNTIDDRSVANTSWNSWYSKRRPSASVPEVLVFDFGPEGRMLDTFRWLYLDNFELRQPRNYSLSYSSDGVNWLPVKNLTNGIVNPSTATVIEKALKSDGGDAEVIGNTVRDNFNNAIDHSRPLWITHTFSPVIARYFKMSIEESGGGQLVKRGKIRASFVGVTEAQFYSLSEELDGVSSYIASGYLETPIVKTGRIEGLRIHFKNPERTSLSVSYRTCPVEENILLQPWREIDITQAATISYSLSELNVAEWFFQARLVLETEDPLNTPEVFYLDLATRPRLTVEVCTSFVVQQAEQAYRLKGEKNLASNAVGLVHRTHYERIDLRRQELHRLLRYFYETTEATSTLGKMRLLVREYDLQVRRLTSSQVQISSVVEQLARLQMDMLTTLLDMRVTELVHNSDTSVKQVDQISTLKPRELGEVEFITPYILSDLHHITPQRLVELSHLIPRLLEDFCRLTPQQVAELAYILPALLEELLGITPENLTEQSDVLVTPLQALYDLVPIQLSSLTGISALELTQMHRINTPLLIAAFAKGILDLHASNTLFLQSLGGVTSLSIDPLHSFKDFNQTTLLQAFYQSIDGLHRVQTLALDSLITAQTYDLVNITNAFSVSKAQFAQWYDINLEHTLNGVHMSHTSFDETMNLQHAPFNSFFDINYETYNSHYIANYKNLNRLAQVAADPVANSYSMLLPTVSKILHVYSAEKINLLPLQPIVRELKHSFHVWTQTKMPETTSPSIPSPILSTFYKTRELESPPIDEGGLNLTLRYPYLPESWDGVSHIGLLKTHERVDVKTFTNNITVDWQPVTQDVVVTERWAAMDYNFYHQLWIFYMQRKHLKYRPKDLNSFEYLVEIISIKANQQHRFWVNGVELKLKIHAEGGSWAVPNSPSASEYKTNGTGDPYNKKNGRPIFPDDIDTITRRIGEENSQ